MRSVFIPALVLFFMLTLGSYKCENTGTRKTVSNDSFFRFGFWNAENLFDTHNDSTNDDDFTPDGANHWNTRRYKDKLAHLAEVIAEINPDVFGLCEVENAGVVKDLIGSRDLKNQYDFVHFDSPDERGIDVALIFKVNVVKMLKSEPLKVVLPGGDRTRDILYIQMWLQKTGDTLHYFVNHWPSRREGTRESTAKRKMAAETLKKGIETHTRSYKNVIVVGDLNDNPWDSSIRYSLGACKAGRNATCDLFNVSALLDVKQLGTLKHAGMWDLFDQVMVSRNLWTENASARVHFKHYSLHIFAPEKLKEQAGKYKGSPFRTYAGKEYQNGYSDHFPVFAELVYE